MRIITIVILSLLAILAGCAGPSGVTVREPVIIPAHSTQRNLQIYWINEIRDTTDTLFIRAGWSALQEMLLGKETIHLYRPHAVHADRDGRIFVADPQANRVHMFDPLSREYRPIILENINLPPSPIGLTSDDAGHLYITDSANNTLSRYSIRDQSLSFLPVVFERPTGIAFDSFLEQLYVVDTLAHQVVVLDPAGAELYRFGGRGETNGLFNYPTDITLDMWGRVLVIDSLNSRIQIFDPRGKFLLAFGTPGSDPGTFSRAKGIATDSTGAIYVSDALTDMIQVFDFSGKHVASFGKSGSDRGEFWMPAGLFIDGDDRLLVADSYNKRIQIFQGLAFADQAPWRVEP